MARESVGMKVRSHHNISCKALKSVVVESLMGLAQELQRDLCRLTIEINDISDPSVRVQLMCERKRNLFMFKIIFTTFTCGF